MTRHSNEIKTMAENYAKAWSSQSPEAVASFYASDGQITINKGDTLKGHHSETKNFVKVGGWEEWELNNELKVQSSLGWFDAQEYERQIAEGA